MRRECSAFSLNRQSESWRISTVISFGQLHHPCTKNDTAKAKKRKIYKVHKQLRFMTPHPCSKACYFRLDGSDTARRERASYFFASLMVQPGGFHERWNDNQHSVPQELLSPPPLNMASTSPILDSQLDLVIYVLPSTVEGYGSELRPRYSVSHFVQKTRCRNNA